ncbi:dihydroxyacetone kinase transcriptional activator DhaS [Dehalobacterium formicoaceticum]|uniref:Dihydroxyacetone kinase transcriptional activator DhaS n=1 Tax=Dehalobacterium formicoaceticum TaxID=51515 RepID=A0ABT1Y5K7_9FIRM|nr:dihydroxyacetone kinase transcriptional activator DhaS [Dehalobacterium formicoaceticum]MCR6546165.1 dihydroxyacetone kinase transcriptional activator DhaS [Dehalobacterium formicoaceticum]
MSNSNITKLALANSLKGLMAKKAFNKICVSDIVDNCGLTRQAFYYHFKDKYDLMNWIYYTETARFMSSYNKVEHWLDGMLDLCNYMRQNKTFYINALNTTGQNSFQEYLHDYIRDISISVIESIKSTEFEEEKWGFIVEFISTAFVGLIVRWADNGMKDDPAEYVMKMRSLFDGSILYELESQSEGIATENPTKLG